MFINLRPLTTVSRLSLSASSPAKEFISLPSPLSISPLPTFSLHISTTSLYLNCKPYHLDTSSPHSIPQCQAKAINQAAIKARYAGPSYTPVPSLRPSNADTNRETRLATQTPTRPQHPPPSQPAPATPPVPARTAWSRKAGAAAQTSRPLTVWT